MHRRERFNFSHLISTLWLEKVYSCLFVGDLHCWDVTATQRGLPAPQALTPKRNNSQKQTVHGTGHGCGGCGSMHIARCCHGYA